MAGNIYLVSANGVLLPMAEQPYDSEALLQTLLASHPDLMAGEQMTEAAPRRWLLLSQEAALSPNEHTSWYVDHLFLDQDGVPTLVEVKRSSDTRIRREVIGQMLDYATHALRLSLADLRARFEVTAGASERIAELTEGIEPDEFWDKVKGNLATGRIRMVFVADEIPGELRDVVNFLAAQLSTAEVFAVEVRNFQGDGGRALVPRLVSTPKSLVSVRPERRWDEDSFFTALKAKSLVQEEVARRLHAWAGREMTWYGRGLSLGSCVPRLFLPDGTRLLLFMMWTNGAIELQFQHMTVAPFDDIAYRRNLIGKLNELPGISIPPDAATKRPSFDMSLLRDDETARGFEERMEWVIQQVVRSGYLTADSAAGN